MTEHPTHNRLSLTGLYVRNAAAILGGIAAVAVMNFLTPLDFFKTYRTLFLTGPDVPTVYQYLGLHMLAGLVAALAVQAWVNRPIAVALRRMDDGGEPSPRVLSDARRRMLNMPTMVGAINFLGWALLPFFLRLIAPPFAELDMPTYLFIAFRTVMVGGMISTTIGVFMLEAHTRKRLVPIFFPQGRLAAQPGTISIPLRRRIWILFVFGTFWPMVFLVLTLTFTQVESEAIDPLIREYGREILVFASALAGMFIVVSLWLNFLVSGLIRRPVNQMVSVVDGVGRGEYDRSIRVVANDELGVLGDAINDMIRGLKDRERIREAFGQYLTPEIRDEILSGRIPLNGERRTATLLFSDMRDFTTYIEDHEPEEAMAGIRDYFTAMHRAIREHGGLVLQFVGDEIEAVFGVPLPAEDHADRAVAAALTMRLRLDELNRRRAAAGQCRFRHGIGIHTGPVLAGNSGSEDQLTYSLIGDTVNVASRIQDLTKEYGHDILASREVLDYLNLDFNFDPGGSRQVKGYSRPVEILRVIGPAGGPGTER